VEVVDRPFEELTQRKQSVDLTLVVVEQRLQGLTKAARPIR
jgi:hypothetical protein